MAASVYSPRNKFLVNLLNRVMQNFVKSEVKSIKCRISKSQGFRFWSPGSQFPLLGSRVLGTMGMVLSETTSTKACKIFAKIKFLKKQDGRRGKKKYALVQQNCILFYLIIV